MRSQTAARVSVLLFVCLVVQHAILERLTFAGAHPDLMVLLPFAAGYVAGPETGAAFGFGSGLVADLLLPTPFGMSALVGCIIGYSTGLATSGLVRGSWWITVVAGLLATAVSLALYAMLGAVLGHPAMVHVDLLPALEVGIPGAVVMAAPACSLVAWALPRDSRSGLMAASGPAR
jgi:rod shape-determining protein MreD